MLARHLQCKTSVRLAQAVTEAVRCFGGSDSHPEAPAPTAAPSIEVEEESELLAEIAEDEQDDTAAEAA